MEKKTMGSFIAALRKANGLTQQDIADRLNVSNKAVSRWERDECMPDITLIPALAELLGVTCDELLRGEKKKPESFAAPAAGRETEDEESETEGEPESGSEPVKEKPDPRTAKQIKAVVKRELSSFKFMSAISVGCSVIGYLLMLGITFGFYRRIIGFTVMAVFAVAAFLLAAIAVGRAKEAKEDNELFDSAPQTLRDRYDRTVGNLSFTAFALAVGTVLVSLPQLFVDSNYTNAIMSAERYFPIALLIAASVTVVAMTVRLFYFRKITGNEELTGYDRQTAKDRAVLDLTQIGALVIGTEMQMTAWAFGQPWHTIITIIGAILILADPVLFFVQYPGMKKRGSDVLIQGIRNIVLLIPAGILNSAISFWESYDGNGQLIRTGVDFDWSLTGLAVSLVFVIFLLFGMMSPVRKNKK